MLRSWMPKLDEIVRCKDCDNYGEEHGMCMMFDCSEVEPDGFCKWGKRRGE